MSNVSHPTAVYEQQAHSSRRVYAADGVAGLTGRSAGDGRDGCRAGPSNTQGHGVLQDSVTQRRMVPGTLSSRRFRREPGRAVRPSKRASVLDPVCCIVALYADATPFGQCAEMLCCPARPRMQCPDWLHVPGLSPVFGLGGRASTHSQRQINPPGSARSVPRFSRDRRPL
jgi:hypothetical protein